MKKWIAGLLAVCLMLCAFPGFAATPITDYTLEEKWDLQMQGSGFKGTVTFQAEGDTAFGMEPLTWQGLKMLLPSVTVDIASMPRDDNRETTVQILKDGAVKGSAHVLTDGVQYAVQSDLINANNVYYAFPKDFDFGFLLQQEDELWPSVWPMLLAMTHADEEWQLRADELASPYMTALAVWMQGYMAVTAEEQGENALTRMYCEIPADDVKNQMKQMMADVYRDEALLSLLREVFTVREAAAYLDGNMQDTFFTMLDFLKIEGNVVIDRLYDAQGNSLLDSISLPFADTERVKVLTIAITPDGEGKATTVHGTFQDGRTFQLIAHAQDDGVVSGSVLMDVQAEESEATETTETAETLLCAFDFNLILDEGEETYDLENDLCAHQQAWDLVLTANQQDTSGMHDMSVSFRREMTSKSSRRAVTYIESSCTVTDQTLGSTLSVMLNCNTASPWTPMTMADLTQQPMQLGTMEESTLATLKGQWKSCFENWLSELMMESFVQGMN